MRNLEYDVLWQVKILVVYFGENGDGDSCLRDGLEWGQCLNY